MVDRDIGTTQRLANEPHTQLLMDKVTIEMVGTKKISLLIVALFVAMTLPFGASAQDDRLEASWQHSNRHGVSIDFRVNSTTIDETYLDNARFLERVDSLLHALECDTTVNIVSVEICGSASPEGPAELNRDLSHARMMALDGYVRSHIDIPDSIITYNDQYIVWNHLKELISEDTDPITHKEQVLEILEQEDLVGYDVLGRKQDGRINAIQGIDKGKTWQILRERYFVQMRNAWFIMVTVNDVVPEPEPEPEPIPEPMPEPEPEPIRMLVEDPTNETFKPIMNLKINGLEAAALIANFGMEFRITPRLSLDIIGHYAPYDYFSESRKVRVLATQPELRWWWGETMVKGHFVGVHVPVAGFNVQLNDNYRYQDPNRALWGVGVSYGYAMPLDKNQKWGVEFTVGVGYMDVVYDVYEGCHNGKLLRTERKNYFGPTRLGINFTYRIDKRVRNTEIRLIEQ